MINMNQPIHPLTYAQIDRSERGEGYDGFTKYEYVVLEFAKVLIPYHRPSGEEAMDRVIARAQAMAQIYFRRVEKPT